MRRPDLDHVRFFPVPRSSHHLIKTRLIGSQGMTYYENLVQILVKNTSIIYNLDHPDCSEEIASIHNMGQFKNPNDYVNTGFTNAVSYDMEADEKTYIVFEKVITNELNNLCFSMDEFNF